MRRRVQKAVGYVVRDDRLLALTHDDFPLEVTGIQVPAGSIEPGEQPAAAVVREVREETGVDVRVVRALGVEQYDMWPSKPELHERYFFQLAPRGDNLAERWRAGEELPSGGGAPHRWTCQWIPLEQAHVLCAGFGARLGEIILQVGDGATAEAG